MSKLSSMLHNRKKFTLIELIVVIGILAILGSLIMPNIKGVESEAKGVALVSDQRAIQTAVDMYNVDHIEPPVLADETTGEAKEITISDPGIISMDKLYPEYLRDLPGTAGAKYWLDYTGKVWVSLADAPVVTNIDGTLSWDAIDGAVEYIVYEYSEASSRIKYNLTEIARVTEPRYIGEVGKRYMVQAVDRKNNKSALAGIGYTGYPVGAAGEDGQDALLGNPINKVAAGKNHTIIVTDTNKVYTFGYNTFGQLGTATNNDANVPNPTPVDINEVHNFDGNIKFVAAGNYHTIITTDTNKVYTFGDNAYGQLGDGTTADSNGEISDISDKFDGNIKVIAAGGSHTIIVTDTNKVYTFGHNQYAQLGTATYNGYNNPSPNPTDISAGHNFDGNIKLVAAGNAHTIIVTDTNKVYTFGMNDYKQLANGESGYAIPTSKDINAIHNFDGNIQSVAAGDSHTVITTDTNKIYAFGYNYFGQLGTTKNSQTFSGTSTSEDINAERNFDGNIKSVVAGENHTVITTDTNKVYAFGMNYYGALGTTTNSGTQNATLTSGDINAEHNFDGNIQLVTAGGSHTIITTDKNKVYTFGRNRYGQLGTTASIGGYTATPEEISDSLVE